MRRMGWAEYVACMRQKRNTYKVLVENSDGKTPLTIPWHRWEDNSSVGIREIGS
jgi:hypothetical protein